MNSLHHNARSSFLSPSPRRVVCAIVLMASVGLAGCNRDKPAADAKPGQALASVNGEEITVLQLNEEMQRAGVPAAQQQVASKPDGTPRKLLDVSRLAALGWRASTPLAEGLQRAYAAYLDARCEMLNREAGARSPEWQVSTRTAHA